MQFEQNADGTWNVWLRADEAEQLPRYAPGTEEELGIRWMMRGLRAGKVPDVCYDDIHKTKDGENYVLRLQDTKDTSGNGGKARIVPIPDDLELRMLRYYGDQGLDHDEPFTNKSKRTVQRWVDRAAANAAEATGDDGFCRVSAHDLRRFFGHHALVVKRLNPRVVMEAGGWQTYSAIEPYLNKPTEEHMVEEFARMYE